MNGASLLCHLVWVILSLLHASRFQREDQSCTAALKIYLLQSQYNRPIVESYKGVVIPTLSQYYTGCSLAILLLKYFLFMLVY